MITKDKNQFEEIFELLLSSDEFTSQRSKTLKDITNDFGDSFEVFSLIDADLCISMHWTSVSWSIFFDVQSVLELEYKYAIRDRSKLDMSIENFLELVPPNHKKFFLFNLDLFS